jgi:hypothetical protein
MGLIVAGIRRLGDFFRWVNDFSSRWEIGYNAGNGEKIPVQNPFIAFIHPVKPGWLRTA